MLGTSATLRIPLVKPRLPSPEALMELMREPLQTGVVTNGGPLVQRAERMVADFVGVEAALFCNGHTALTAMLRAFDVAGGEVICPSFTFVSTPSAIVAAGATPVFADINESLTLDSEDVKRKFSPQTKAVLTVDAYGIPSDYAALKTILGDIPLLADSAAAFGSIGDEFGNVVGRQADAHIFSFHATKQITAIEGGAVVSSRPEIIAACRRIRNFGQGGDGIREIGLNGKMSELHAAVLLWNFENDRHDDKRFVVVDEYQEELEPDLLFDFTSCPGTFGAGANFLYFPIRVSIEMYGISADRMMRELLKRGIGSRRYYEPCHLMPVFGGKRRAEFLFFTELVGKEVLCLPCYPELAGDDQAEVIEAVNEIVRTA